MNYNMLNLSLTYTEVVAIQALLGYVQLHTNKDLYSVSMKLEEFSNPDDVDCSQVKFIKLSKNHMDEVKTYKNSNFAIKFVESK